MVPMGSVLEISSPEILLMARSNSIAITLPYLREGDVPIGLPYPYMKMPVLARLAQQRQEDQVGMNAADPDVEIAPDPIRNLKGDPRKPKTDTSLKDAIATMAPHLKQFYDGLLEGGFSTDQAMTLTAKFMESKLNAAVATELTNAAVAIAADK